MMGVTRISLSLAAAAAAAGVLAFILLGGNPERSAGAAGTNDHFDLPVPVVVVVKKQVPIYLDYVGTAEAIRSVTLESRVIGYLESRGAADGADVKRGELLYRIDRRDYQAALDQAEAQAERDSAVRDYSRANQHRNAMLVRNGWVSQDTYDQTTSTLHQAQAGLAADLAAAQTAKLNLAYTEIRAPFAGRLGRSLVHEGALINVAGTQLNTLVQLDPIYATFNPSDRDLARIQHYLATGPISVEVEVPGDDALRLEGRLTFIDNVVDRSTGTITARATIANPSGLLLPGRYLHVRLRLFERPDTLLVPQVALGSSQLGKFLYIVGKNHRAERRFVTPGEAYGDAVVIEKGVCQGEIVIVGNLQKLSPGTLVQPQSQAD